MSGNVNAVSIFLSPIGYLAPSIVMGLLLLRFKGAMAAQILQFTGVLIHESLHFIVGLLTMAQPSSISLIPKVEGKRLVLGSVGFLGLTWFNAWITALAPLLALPIIYGLASWRLTEGPKHFLWGDILVWLVFAPQWLNCWPSRADWKLVLISWPFAVLLASASVIWVWAFG